VEISELLFTPKKQIAKEIAKVLFGVCWFGVRSTCEGSCGLRFIWVWVYEKTRENRRVQKFVNGKKFVSNGKIRFYKFNVCVRANDLKSTF